jgi:DnaJ-class molecular chaperone
MMDSRMLDSVSREWLHKPRDNQDGFSLGFPQRCPMCHGWGIQGLWKQGAWQGAKCSACKGKGWIWNRGGL